MTIDAGGFTQLKTSGRMDTLLPEAGTASLTSGNAGLRKGFPRLTIDYRGGPVRHYVDFNYLNDIKTPAFSVDKDSLNSFFGMEYGQKTELRKQMDKAMGIIEIDPALERVKRLRMAVSVAAKGVMSLHAPEAIGRPLFATLTYDTRAFSAEEIEAHKYATPRDISNFVKKVRTHYRQAQCDEKAVLTYIWVAELQQRGVLHYHVIFFVPEGVSFPFFDIGMRDRRSKKALRKQFWPHGRCNIKRATSPVGYLIKYASKMDTKGTGFPKCCRMYGMGGLCKEVKDIKRWMLWPSYVRSNCEVGAPMKRYPGGGYINKFTGEVFLSEYGLMPDSFTRFIKIREVHKIFPEIAGPFCFLRIQSPLSNLAQVQSGEKP